VRSRVLYFPYIQVPETSWLTQMLLYWDQVSSIVPSQYIADPESLGPYMLRLVQEELVRQVIPGMYIYEIPRFSERFLGYLDGLGPELDRRREDFAHQITFRIHIEKMHNVGRALADLRLAEPRDGPWYNVEGETAHDFMSYLAATLGEVHSINASPVTDSGVYLNRLACAGVPDDSTARQLDSLRLQVLDRVLPIPDGQVEPFAIRAFKQHHGAELRDFRRRVEQELVTAAAIENVTLRDRHLELFIDEAKARIEEIRSSMRGAGWRTAERGLSVIAAIPGASPLLGLAGAIWGAVSGGNQPQVARDFAYAAHAGAELAGLS